MTRRERAITYIEECRAIHVRWIELQDMGHLSYQERKIGGGKTWHRKWVRQYDAVLAELRS